MEVTDAPLVEEPEGGDPVVDPAELMPTEGAGHPGPVLPAPLPGVVPRPVEDGGQVGVGEHHAGRFSLRWRWLTVPCIGPKSPGPGFSKTEKARIA